MYRDRTVLSYHGARSYALGVARSPALQDHIANAILEEAARVLAERREAASLSDIAQASGVARSTLYRYFPNRDALLQALAERAARELRARIEEAELDTIAVPEAIARLTRGFIATGTKFVALAYLSSKPAESADPHLSDPIARLFERGIADGSLRSDVPADALVGIYGDLIQGAIARAAHGHNAVEQASAAILAVFLSGTLATKP
jgi:AcrR family transcriptional regulator